LAANASLFIANDVGKIVRSLWKVAVAFENEKRIFNLISRPWDAAFKPLDYDSLLDGYNLNFQWLSAWFYAEDLTNHHYLVVDFKQATTFNIGSQKILTTLGKLILTFFKNIGR